LELLLLGESVGEPLGLGVETELREPLAVTVEVFDNEGLFEVVAERVVVFELLTCADKVVLIVLVLEAREVIVVEAILVGGVVPVTSMVGLGLLVDNVDPVTEGVTENDRREVIVVDFDPATELEGFAVRLAVVEMEGDFVGETEGVTVDEELPDCDLLNDAEAETEVVAVLLVEVDLVELTDEMEELVDRGVDEPVLEGRFDAVVLIDPVLVFVSGAVLLALADGVLLFDEVVVVVGLGLLDDTVDPVTEGVTENDRREAIVVDFYPATDL